MELSYVKSMINQYYSISNVQLRMFLKNFIEIINDTVDIDITLQEVVNIMSQNKLHHIIIIKDKKPIGIITEKDIVRLFKNNINFNELAIDHAVQNLITLHSTRLVQYALSVMIDNNIRKIIVINSKDEYLGCIEQEQIVYRFEEELQETNITIHQLLNPNNEAVVIDENDTLQYALKIMTKYSLTSLLISTNKVPIGIISESDIMHLAQKQISHTKQVKNFMHSPIITIDIHSSVSDMITTMRENDIRRMVIKDPQYNIYHILNSKDLVSNLRGNYTTFLESKLHDTRDTFNALSEYVIELIDLQGEQVIYWTNGITKTNFNINVDDNITKIIPSNIWKDIFRKLLTKKTVFETVQIHNQYFQIKGHYGTILDDNIIKIFLNDITEITKLNIQLQKENDIKEQLLFNQAKMVQMGEMIGNIAHQWRQPLSVILAASTSLQLRKQYDILSDKLLDESCDEITKHTKYLSDTIDNFRNFIKEKKEKKELVLQKRINIALDIASTVLKNNHIKLINSIDNDDILITMVAGELEQVIINILNNAKDILIEKQITNPWIEITLVKKDDHAIISIEDNAEGIPQNILPHIFNEYFTTKDEAQGTGLGLYMSFQIIIKSLNGKLYTKNTKNGAKFFIELPLNS